MSILQRFALTKLQAWTASRPTLRSGSLRIPTLPNVEPLIYRAPDWKTDLIDRVLRKRQGLFVDVGANIGQTLVDYFEAGARGGYIGFEPNSRCIDIIMGIARLNKIADVKVLPIGLSDKSTVVPFYVRPDRAVDTTATMVAELRPDDLADITYVPVHPFDKIYAEVLDTAKLALVKIDVEGGELAVLRGMRQTLRIHRPWVLCEVLARDPAADPATYAERCAAVMRIVHDAGYQALRVAKATDDRTLTGFCRVDAFPNSVYGPATMHDCDYMLVPAADVVALAQIGSIEH